MCRFRQPQYDLAWFTNYVAVSHSVQIHLRCLSIDSFIHYSKGGGGEAETRDSLELVSLYPGYRKGKRERKREREREGKIAEKIAQGKEGHRKHKMQLLLLHPFNKSTLLGVTKFNLPQRLSEREEKGGRRSKGKGDGGKRMTGELRWWKVSQKAAARRLEKGSSAASKWNSISDATSSLRRVIKRRKGKNEEAEI